jgi:hypothetical protein
MKTALLAGLALAALSLNTPAFGHDGRGGGGGSGGGGGRAAVSTSAPRASGFSGGHTFSTGRGFSGGTVSGGRSYSSGRQGFAFGGSSNYRGGYNHGGHGWGRRGGGGVYYYGGYPYYSYPYYSYPYYDNEYYSSPSYSNYDSGDDESSVGASVQRDLAQQGYYRGPVDGLVGPMTSAAIAAYQRDNRLPVTGTITHSLLRSLGED